jgi:hypothetical protein
VSIDDLSLSLFPHIPPPTQLSESYWERQLTLSTVQSAAAATTTGLGQAMAASSCGCVQYTQHTDLSLSLSLSSCRDCRPEGSETIREHSYPLCPFRFLDAAIVFLESRSLFAI